MSSSAWRIWTKYPNEEAWEVEFVPNTDSTIFRNWEQLAEFFQSLMNHGGVLIRIDELPVMEVKE